MLESPHRSVYFYKVKLYGLEHVFCSFVDYRIIFGQFNL